MVAPNSSDENVQIKIDFLLQLDKLQEALLTIDSVKERTDLVRTAVKEMAAQFGVSSKAIVGDLKAIKAEEERIFGKGKSNLENINFNNVLKTSGESVKVMGENLSLTGAKFSDFENKTQSLSSKLLNFNNIARTVFGTLTALAVFQVIQFFAALGQQLVVAAQQADKLVRAIVDLRNIETILSESGIEVNMKDLFDIVSRLEEKFKLLSKIDLTELVASLAIATRELRFTPDEIERLATVAALLAETQNIDTKSASEAVVRSLTGKSQGNNVLKQAGITMTPEIIAQEALRLNLIEKQGDALSQQVTALSVLSLLEQKSVSLNKQIAELEASEAGRVALVSKAWGEFLTTIGEGFYGVVANASDTFLGVITMFTAMANTAKLIYLGITANVYASIQTIRAAIAGEIKSLEDLTRIQEQNKEAYFRNVTPTLFKTPIKESDTGIGSNEQLRDFLNQYITDGNKATGVAEDFNKALELTPEQSEKASDTLNDLAEDLQRLGERAEEMTEKYDTAVARDKEDFDTKNLRQLEDYNRDIFELSRETNEKIADSQRKHREREAADERKFQERMLELREKFLFDLEDALHERDARQVLRLIRGYNLEKEQEIRKHALENRERAEQNAVELADIKKQAADKFEQLNYEYATRKQRELEDYNEREERRLADYQREQAQLQEQIDARIEKASIALSQELGLNAEGQALIYELLNAYYKPGGIFDSLYDHSYKSLVAKTRFMVQELAILAAQASAQAAAQINSQSNSNTDYYNPDKAIPFASGGMAIANKPTKALFGEKESELALFIPLSKLANVMGRGSSPGETSGGNSSIALELTLSPDLEARIVKKSVDTVTDVVATVRRNKK